MTFPADICNRALMAIGSDATLADPDLQEGTREAEACLKIYGPTMRQLMRCAHWNFARKQAVLTLLNDATGQTTGPSTTPGDPGYVGTGTIGMGPWVYEYAWPIDALKARFVPTIWGSAAGSVPSGNIALPNGPIMAGLAPASPFVRQVPARFVVTQDSVLTQIGVPTSWDQMPDTQGIQGQGPDRQTVVLTNVKDATLVYTALIVYPDMWDPLFQEAMVSALGERLAMPCLSDKKFALQVRAKQIGVAKAALDAARRVDGDEGWFNVDHTPDWLRIRGSGSTYAGAGEIGTLWGGWDSYAFSDGSAY